ncbi:MAG: hypothetical protein JRI95_10080 [Deltaproteobacteria bacterium]|nr:hypothetical protein [Deltaproteobacteria bacterium]MBW2085831.1 hypothetical protein [Deltaproteobacteria bacterium]
MKSNMIHLVKLQKLDTTLERLRLAETEGPQRLVALDAELMQAEAKVRDSLELEKEQKKRRRDLETRIDETEAMIKKYQSRQFEVKTNEEYKALLKEIEFQKKEKTEAEDEVLQLMESLEVLEEENKRIEVWLKEQSKALALRKKKVEEWVASARQELEENRTKRETLIKDLPRNVFAMYERVYAGFNGRAVVPIIDGICQECHLQIPPQQFNELQRNDQVMSCPNCGRLIYWQGHEDYQDL